MLATQILIDMTIYLCYECYYDFCDVWRVATKAVDDEVKALVWKDESPITETTWREYEKMELE